MSLYEGPIFRVERRDGRDVVVHAPVAAIVALDRREQLTLVRQHRVPVGQSMLELPAGFIDGGESPLAAAQRELAEETGLHGGEWIEVATFFTSAGFTDETLHLFLATDLQPARRAGSRRGDQGRALPARRSAVVDRGVPGREDARRAAASGALPPPVGLPAA